LRAQEVCDLEWSQVDWRAATLHVRRVKSGKPAAHPIRGDELRALRELQRNQPASPFVFTTERGGPFTTDAVNRLVKRLGDGEKLFAAPAVETPHLGAYECPLANRTSCGPPAFLTQAGSPTAVDFSALMP